MAWGGVLGLYLAVMLALAVGSVSGFWPFPAVLPDTWTWRAWTSVWNSLDTVGTTLTLATASAVTALAWSVAWLECAPPRWIEPMRRGGAHSSQATTGQRGHRTGSGQGQGGAHGVQTVHTEVQALVLVYRDAPGKGQTPDTLPTGQREHDGQVPGQHTAGLRGPLGHTGKAPRTPLVQRLRQRASRGRGHSSKAMPTTKAASSHAAASCAFRATSASTNHCQASTAKVGGEVGPITKAMSTYIQVVGQHRRHGPAQHGHSWGQRARATRRCRGSRPSGAGGLQLAYPGVGGVGTLSCVVAAHSRKGTSLATSTSTRPRPERVLRGGTCPTNPVAQGDKPRNNQPLGAIKKARPMAKAAVGNRQQWPQGPHQSGPVAARNGGIKATLNAMAKPPSEQRQVNGGPGAAGCRPTNPPGRRSKSKCRAPRPTTTGE